MPRYALMIEYDGTPFRGWQVQKEQLTVQGTINNALLSLEPNSTGITGAGRTDSGVHALGQVGHVDLKKYWDPKSLIHALSYHVKPYPISFTIFHLQSPITSVSDKMFLNELYQIHLKPQ